MADIKFASFIEEREYHVRNKQLQKEVNWGDPTRMYFPDKTVFKKTTKEKEQLLTLKWKNKQERKKAYGENYKKFLNIPSKQLITIKMTM